MATTGAVLYLRPTLEGATRAARNTGAQMFVAVRALSSVWTQDGVSATANRKNFAVDLPSAIAPMGYARINGQQVPVFWEPTVYRFLRFLYEEKLGGIAGLTVPDVVASVAITQAAATEAARQAQDVAVQTQANAEALAVVRQVVRNNDLEGSEQIPGVELR